MGYHGSIGNSANRARAASTSAPTTHPYGRHSEASGRRLRAGNRQPAPGPSKVQVVSHARSTHHLSRVRHWRRTRLEERTAQQSPRASQLAESKAARREKQEGPSPFRSRACAFQYFLVLAVPVVVCWPGAYSEAPGAFDFLALFILWPGVDSDAPGPVVLFCILWPGVLPDAPGDVPCATADAAKSMAPETLRNFLIMSCSFSVDDCVQRSEARQRSCLSLDQRSWCESLS